MNITTDKPVKPKTEAPRPAISATDPTDIHALIAAWVRSRDGGEMEEIYVVYKPVGRRRGVIPVNLAVAEPVGGDDLTDGERAILEVFRNAITPLTRKAAAARLGHTTPDGRFGEQFRQLMKKEKLFKHGQHYTDDAKKYAAMDNDDDE